jgi:hypothetical protein
MASSYDAVHYPDYPVGQEIVIVSTKKMPPVEWLTLNAAAKRDDCPVTGNTLREMIHRGDVPEDCYQKRPFGDTRIIYYIDANCLRRLDYREPGQRGKAKPE